MLVAIVIALVVLQFVVVAIVLAGSRDHELTARRVEAGRAFYAAEAVLQMAMREAVTGSDLDGDGTVGGIGPTGFGAGSAQVSAIEDGAEITLTASSVVGQARRSSSTVLRRTGGGGRGAGVEVWLLSSSPSQLSSVDWNGTPSFTGVVPDINFPGQSDSIARFAGMPTSRFAMRFRARLDIPNAGDWTFSTNSDDGSDLWIDGTRVVANDGLYGMTTRSGTISLTAGLHDLEVRFFENGGSNGLIVSWQAPGASGSTVIPASAYSTTGSMPPLAAHSTMYLYGDNSNNATTVDAYNSSAGAYGGGNVLSSGAIAALNSTTASSWQMTGKAELRGSAVVGPGGSPGTVIALSDSSIISGTQTAGNSRVAIFAAQPSITSASSGNINLTGSATQTISSDGRWGSITLANNSVLTLSGATTIRIDGNLTVQDNALLALEPDADITMYVAGNVTLSGDALVGSSAAAPRLRIYMNGSSQDVSISSRAKMSAYVLNPFGRLVIAPIGNTPDSFSGRFAGDGVLTADKTDIHLDVADDSGGSGLSSIRVLSWMQTQP